MNTKGLKIRFPVIDCGPWCVHFRGPAIILHCEPIAPAHALRDPDPQMRVTGQLQDGRHIQFTVSQHTWQDALKQAPLFVSVAGDKYMAPPGVLVDQYGMPLKQTLLKSVPFDSATG